MSNKNVKYTQLNNYSQTPKFTRCWSSRKLFSCFFTLILFLLGLLYLCYNKTNICGKPNIHIKHTKRRLPQCLIIGARKAGTRALLTYLRLHPDIQTAQFEVHFFDNQENYDSGYEWYKKQMPYSFKDQLTIEKSPAYFNVPSVPGKVYKMNSTIKLLLIVRDPVERSISDQLQLTVQRRDLGLKIESLEETLTDKHGEIDKNQKPISRSFYDVFMKNWLEYFSLSQIHIIDGDNMIKNPYSEIYKTESFLGLRHVLTKDMFVYNSTKGFYCVKTETKEKCLSDSKGRKHPDVEEKVLRKMRKVFWQHNENFFKLINRTFDWNTKP